MKKAMSKIASHYQLKMVILFGSVAKDRQMSDSDVDIAILPAKKINLNNELSLRHEFSQIFKREVDLTFLTKAGPLVLRSIARDGRLLYGKEKDFIDFKIQSMKKYADFEPYFKLQEKINIHTIKELIKNAG